MKIDELLTEAKTSLEDQAKYLLSIFPNHLKPVPQKSDVSDSKAVFTYKTVPLDWKLIKDNLSNRRINALAGEDKNSVDGYTEVTTGKGKNKVEYFASIHYKPGSLKITFDKK